MTWTRKSPQLNCQQQNNTQRQIVKYARPVSWTSAAIQPKHDAIHHGNEHRKWAPKQFNILSITITHDKHLDLLVWRPLFEQFGRATVSDMPHDQIHAYSVSGGCKAFTEVELRGVK